MRRLKRIFLKNNISALILPLKGMKSNSNTSEKTDCSASESDISGSTRGGAQFRRLDGSAQRRNSEKSDERSVE